MVLLLSSPNYFFNQTIFLIISYQDFAPRNYEGIVASRFGFFFSRQYQQLMLNCRLVFERALDTLKIVLLIPKSIVAVANKEDYPLVLEIKVTSFFKERFI